MCSIDLINPLFNPCFICFTFRGIHFLLLLTISFAWVERCVEWIEFKFVEGKGLRGLQNVFWILNSLFLLNIFSLCLCISKKFCWCPNFICFVILFQNMFFFIALFNALISVGYVHEMTYLQQSPSYNNYHYNTFWVLQLEY